MMRDDLVGILRIAGRGRAVRYILVITASSNVITVVMIRVIAKKTPAMENYKEQLNTRRNLSLTEEGPLASGRDAGNDHCEEDHHRHHRCDAHRHLKVGMIMAE